jgi:hypothetical protein
MSSYRNVFWRGAFALALVPVSAGIVAANGSAPEGAKTQWCYELAVAEMHERVSERERAVARQLAAAKVQELRVIAVEARARARSQPQG